MVPVATCRWKRTSSRALVVGALASLSILTPPVFAEAASRAALVSPEIDNWNNFYAVDVEAAYRFVGAFIVIVAALYASSGLISGILVTVSAVEWKPAPLRITRVLGPVLILTTATLLPVYAMFRPFSAHDIVHIWAWSVLLGLFAAMFALFIWSQSGLWNRRSIKDVLRNWWPFLVTLLAICVPGASSALSPGSPCTRQ